MKVRSLTLLMGGMFAMSAAALIVAACSSDTAANTDLNSKKKDSGKSSGSDDTAGTDSTGDDDDDTTTDGGVTKNDAASTVSCSTAKIRSTATLFCQFQAKLPDGGYAPDCTPGSTCCLQDYGEKSPSTCVDRKGASATCPTGTTAWECSDTSQCGAGKECCLGVADATKYDGGVSIGTKNGCPSTDTYAFNEAPTTCRTSCNPGEVKVTQACEGGAPTPFRAGLYDLAYCKP